MIERPIIEQLGQEEILCQIAEEASELAQAALKYRRAISGKNPTPVTEAEAYRNLLEEYADCAISLQVFGVQYGDITGIMWQKYARWKERMEALQNVED